MALDGVLGRVLDGEAVPNDELVGAVWPVALEVVRTTRSLGRLRSSEDDVRDVTVAVLEKVSRDGGRGIKLYGDWRARNPERTFEDWLRIVAGNAARDHVRRRLGARTPAGDELPSVKRMLNEFSSSPRLEELGVRPPMTDQQTAEQLIEFAQTKLREEQFRALVSWLEGAELGDDARKLVRAAVAVLRRHFGRT
jgi:hypothetical protein